jgi:TRAP-type C4-dicarboxylate transport system permease large subunit
VPYAVARVSQISFDRMVKAVMPFYIPLLLVLVLITIFPEISLIGPRLLFARVRGTKLRLLGDDKDF